MTRVPAAAKRSLLFLILWAIVGFSGGAAAQVPTPPGEGEFILSSPTCTTLDRERVETTAFSVGDELVVRGANYPSDSLVLLTFRQGPVTLELGRFRTNEAGTFTTEPTMLRVPEEAAPGPATIHASSGGPSGTCGVEVAAPAAPRAEPIDDEPEESTNAWFLAWGILLAIGGGALTFAGYRYWQEKRLARAISRSGDARGRRRAGGSRRRSGPPRLDSVDLPPRIEDAPAQTSYASPPVLPPGWDSGREPVPDHGTRNRDR